MRLKLPDYTKLVKAAYRKKSANGELSNLLTESTRASIRLACFNLYKPYCDTKENKILRKDEHTLNDFFGPTEHGRQFLQLIQDTEAERFRTLNNYLKSITENNDSKKNTDKKNLELLAWLIDFPHRPYIYGKDIILNEEELAVINQPTNDKEKRKVAPVAEEESLQKNEYGGNDILKEEPREEPAEDLMKACITLETISENSNEKEKPRRTIILFLALTFFTVDIYTLWQKTANAHTVSAYWAGDHYRQVFSNEESMGHLIIPIDSERIKTFRRITKTDTITERSIGKVYYIRDSNKVKYYTEWGRYPEDINRYLKPLSMYMFKKHLQQKNNSSTDSLNNNK